MLADHDLTGSSTWDGDRDINVVCLVHDPRDKVGELRGDCGVGFDWGRRNVIIRCFNNG